MISFFQLSLAFWITLYECLHQFEQRQIIQNIWPEVENSSSTTVVIGTIAHAAIVIPLGLCVISQDSRLEIMTDVQRNFILISYAWFWIDCLWILRDRNWRKDMIFHHIICMITIQTVLSSNSHGFLQSAVICFGEMGPCVYFDVLAKRWNMCTDRFSFINDTSYVIIFSLTRFIIIPIIGYLLWISCDLWLLRLTTTCMIILSIYWGLLVAKKYYFRWICRQHHHSVLV